MFPTVVCAGFLFSFLPFTTVFTSNLLALLPFLPSHFLSCTGNGRKALFPKKVWLSKWTWRGIWLPRMMWLTDRGLYVENSANMKQVPYITCVNIPVLFYDLRHHPLPPSFSPPPFPSPPPPIGRGIEHANARSKYCYRNRCTHIIKEMENEIRCLPFTIFYFSPVHSLQLSLQLLAFNYAGNILHVLYFTIFWFASGVCILQIFEDTLSAWRSSRCLWQLSMKEEPTTTNARAAWE